MRIFLTPDEIALERYQIIRPCLSEGASREEIARAAGLTSRTIRLWIGQFNREGLPGLRPHIRKDAGGRRKIVPELAQVIEGLCLRTPPLPVTAIHRSVLVLCQKNKWRAPSYDVVHDICSKISRDIKTLAHEGPSAYEQAFELLHRHEAEAPNEVWQADHAQLDILIFDSNGRAMKPWLTAALDDFSRAVPGYYLGFEPPCSMRIAMTCDSRFGEKKNQHGAFVAFQTSSTRIAEPILCRSISTRCPLISNSNCSTLCLRSRGARARWSDFLRRWHNCF